MFTLHFNFVTVYAQTDEQRKQLSEERQISRMILTIQEQRDIISSHEKENERLNSLVQNLDRQIANLQRISDEHKTAADERAKAIDLHKQAKAIYKESLDDAKMQISKLEKSVSFWQKVSGVAFIFGLIFGFYAKGSWYILTRMATEKEKDEFRKLFDFPEALADSSKVFQRANLINRIIEHSEKPEPLPVTNWLRSNALVTSCKTWQGFSLPV